MNPLPNTKIGFLKHVPNTITCLNLFAGCLACIAAFRSQYELVVVFVGLAAIFDFLDGLAARLLHAYSPMGKELDSLADMVSFGFVPGLIAYSILNGQTDSRTWGEYAVYAAFLIPIFSALRLAKFNIDERQTSSFIGMPTPANAIFWVGLSFLYQQYPQLFPTEVVLIIIVLLSYLLVAELPMFSLKIKSLSWKASSLQYLIISIAAFWVVFLGVGGLAATILCYILLSIINDMYKKQN